MCAQRVVELRAAIDTNVAVSALIAAGPPSRVLEEAVRGRFELIVPEPVTSELMRVLIAKLGFSVADAGAACQFLAGIASLCPAIPPESICALSGDPADDCVLACALAAQAEVLITGDRRHLLPLGVVDSMRIVTPQAWLVELIG